MEKVEYIVEAVQERLEEGDSATAIAEDLKAEIQMTKMGAKQRTVQDLCAQFEQAAVPDTKINKSPVFGKSSALHHRSMHRETMNG